MTNRDKFAARAAVYAFQILKDIAQSQNDRSLDVFSDSISPSEIRQWLSESEASQQLVTAQGLEWDDQFLDFWTQLIDSAQRSLREAAEAQSIPLAELSLDDIIHWFEQRSRLVSNE